MKRAYKYRIYPSEEQKRYFSVCFAANRWFWNYALDKIVKVFEENKTKEEKDKIPSAQYEIARELPNLKKEENTSWINQADAISFIYTSQDLDGALKKFFKKQGGFPKFKNKKYQNSYTIQVNKKRQNIINWKNGFIHIGKAGKVKCVLHRKFNGEIKAVTVSKKSYDFYEISILVDDIFNKAKLQQHTYEGTIGIDMGSKDSEDGGNAILSDGTKFPVINYKKEDKRIKKLKRKLSKKEWIKTGEKKFSKKYNKEVEVKIPSKNYIKLKDKIAKLEDKIARRRAYNTHQISSYVAKNDNFDTVAIETLNVKGMLRNHRNARCNANGNMGELGRQLAYKCEWFGKNLVKVDRWFASTKTCSVCGNKYKVGEKRSWTCPICRTHHDRDINAAINLKEEGHRILTEGKQ